MEKAESFQEKTEKKSSGPAMKKTGEILGRTGSVLTEVCRWIYKLRSVFLAIPVAFAAINFAIFNQQNLPERVGINLQATGEYAMMIQRGSAVMWPLAITGGCLLLMFCSRKVLYPWLISVFSLVIPWLIYFTNIYPA